MDKKLSPQENDKEKVTKIKLNDKQRFIVDKIISNLEKGNLEWIKTWKSGIPLNYKTKKEYNGINSLVLNLIMQERGYKSPYFLTFLQIKEMGGIVKSGEHSSTIFFYEIKEKKKMIENKDTKEMEEIKYHVPILRMYNVFNVEQTDLKIIDDKKEFNPIENAENIIKEYLKQIKVFFKESKAYYSPSEDYINLPPKNNFIGNEEFYSTLYHELSHSTGHKSRLNRDTIQEISFFGDTDYSKEEVIAELSTCFLCSKAGIENKTLNNSSAYIQGWLRALKQDGSFLFKIVGQAQKSANYILKYKENTQ